MEHPTSIDWILGMEGIGKRRGKRKEKGMKKTGGMEEGRMERTEEELGRGEGEGEEERRKSIVYNV